VASAPQGRGVIRRIPATNAIGPSVFVPAADATSAATSKARPTTRGVLATTGL